MINPAQVLVTGQQERAWFSDEQIDGDKRRARDCEHFGRTVIIQSH